MAAPEPGEKALPGKDWRKHIWKKKDSGKKKSKKKAKRKPEITPASYIYATIESSEKEMLALPSAVERVFRQSRRLLVDMDFSAEAVESWEKSGAIWPRRTVMFFAPCTWSCRAAWPAV